MFYGAKSQKPLSGVFSSSDSMSSICLMADQLIRYRLPRLPPRRPRRPRLLLPRPPFQLRVPTSKSDHRRRLQLRYQRLHLFKVLPSGLVPAQPRLLRLLRTPAVTATTTSQRRINHRFPTISSIVSTCSPVGAPALRSVHRPCGWLNAATSLSQCARVRKNSHALPTKHVNTADCQPCQGK